MTPKRILFALVSATILALTGCSSHKNPPDPAPPTSTVADEVAPTIPNRSAVSPRNNVRREGILEPVQTPTYMPTNEPIHTPFVQEEPEIRELASHETKYDEKAKNRATKIKLASQTIDGHIVQPGEVFSYNETVGPTNQGRGYKKDTIFVRGEKKQGFGGGVCQVSTTLYNAAANADMLILERHDHSLPVGYAESGKEAATSYGGIDFKFENSKPFPIMINSTAANGTIYVTITTV